MQLLLSSLSVKALIPFDPFKHPVSLLKDGGNKNRGEFARLPTELNATDFICLLFRL
jgi:hypothetical protein